MKRANFIGGEFRAPLSGDYLPAINPATGEVHAQIPASDAADIDAAVQAAQAAFPAWRCTPAAERATYLNRIADGLAQRLDEFAEAESRDQGKPVALAKQVDIPRAIHNFRYFAGLILHHTNLSTDMDGAALNYVHRKPMGVAGLISPWNLPMYLMTWKIAPAIALGNTCVAKPSELTSLTATMFGEVLQAAALPPGVCNLVFGTGLGAGAPLVKHPQVPLISFTGGTVTGRALMADAAPRTKKLSLELGGKNANIVFADADFDKAVSTSVRAAFTNQGEVCLCGSRLFVERSIYDRFLAAFCQAVSALKVGDPAAPETQLGALVSAAHRDKVAGYIELAKAEGGTIATGGGRPDLPPGFGQGYFLEPTVITGLSPRCRVQQEEIFGPVVTVTPFDSDDEVIDYANGTPYGLSATLWTRDLSRAHRVAQAMDAGIVWVNCWMRRDLRTPFGGMKASGVGREGGEESVAFYTEPQNICIEY